MVSICPTITVSDLDHYKQEMNVLSEFATRIHIDVADGTMTPSRLVNLKDIWWAGNVQADIHIMNLRPLEYIDELIALHPTLVIAHAEGRGSFADFADALHDAGIEVGIALLPTTVVDTIVPALDMIDHVLIFSGNLGFQGGQANLALLSKAQKLRSLKPSLEIGWDGGVNDQNALLVAAGGVDVLNVGGYIARSTNPKAAYAKLKLLVGDGA